MFPGKKEEKEKTTPQAVQVAGRWSGKLLFRWSFNAESFDIRGNLMIFLLIR